MANNFKISTAARNAACNAVVDLLDAGTGAATMKMYTGTQPAGPDTAIGTQTLLGTLTFSATAFGAAATGVATASAITDDTSADATGTAAWFRCADAPGANAIFDGELGTSGSDINFNTLSWTAGDAISVTSFTVTQPA